MKIGQNLLSAIDENAPLKAQDGGIFSYGFDTTLDELRERVTNNKTYLLSYQQELIQETGIEHIKIKFSRNIGYYIEIPPKKQSKVPPSFIARQTLTNAIRYTTEKLNSYQESVLNAEERLATYEQELYQKLLHELQAYIPHYLSIAQHIADIDCYSSFAHLATHKRYCKPLFHTSQKKLSILDGRHPVGEQMIENFIANDTDLSHKKYMGVITGPNMGGKSTYLRTNALITYLAHIGSYVPAKECILSPIDALFTRIGSGDSLQEKESTFMSEMMETSKCIHFASEDSLIIIDELGRGTSPHEGYALALALFEYIHNTIRARTFFATHYHELAHDIESFTHAINLCVEVIENDNSILFSHKIIEGKASHSYGIEIAKRAGIPQDIINKAYTYLTKSQNQQELPLSFPLPSPPPDQCPVKKDLEILNVQDITPIQALNILHEWKQKHL